MQLALGANHGLEHTTYTGSWHAEDWNGLGVDHGLERTWCGLWTKTVGKQLKCKQHELELGQE